MLLEDSDCELEGGEELPTLSAMMQLEKSLVAGTISSVDVGSA
jgi:hypothetical protein